MARTPAKAAAWSLPVVIACQFALFAPGVAVATNTGGVFGPVVNAGHQSLEYRGGLDPDSDDYAQRLHYQRSLDGQRMWRVVVQSRHPDNGSDQFDFVQGELFWQLGDISENWQTGLRFDVAIRDRDRPGLVGVNWTNQLRLTERLSARFLAMAQHEIGANARDGLILQTRARLRYAVNPDYGAGIEMFNVYGPLPDLSGFDDQGHQLGPFFDMQLGQGVQLFAGALFGVSDAAPDANLRLWVTFGF